MTARGRTGLPGGLSVCQIRIRFTTKFGAFHDHHSRLIILVAALIVGVAGVLGNGGGAHMLSHVSMLGYHVTGSVGTLFRTGIVVGAAGCSG